MPDENLEGSQNPSGQQNQDSPKTSDQPDIGNVVNSAVTSHLKRFTEKQLPTILEGALKPILEQIASLKAAPPADQPGDDAGKKKVDPQVAVLTQQLEAVKQQLAQEAEQRAAAEKKAREDRAFAEFKGYLSKSVRPEMLDMVASYLFHIKKVVDVADDGTATFKGTRTNFGITEEIAYPLKDGVESWLKSDEAKPYLPVQGGVSNTPTTRKVIGPSRLPKDFDLSKATPAQRLQYAEELEKQYSEILKQRGFN